MLRIFAIGSTAQTIRCAAFAAILSLGPSLSHSAEARLTWVAPTENTDGSALTDLAGYRIYSGCVQSGQYERPTIDVPSTENSFIVIGLPETGTCYFSVTAYSGAGVESALSAEASKLMGIEELPGPIIALSVDWSESVPPSSIFELAETDFSGQPFDAGAFNVGPNTLDIAFSINPRSFPDSWPRVISKASGTSSQDHVFMVSLNYGKLRFRLKTDGNTTTLVGNTDVPLNTVTNGRVTYDGSQMVIYFNGSVDGSVAKSGLIDQTADPVWVGGNPPNNASPFDGSIAVTVN